MGELKNYLLSRKDDIQQYEQPLFHWKAHYQNASVMDMAEFREVYDDLSEPISRQMVIDIFRGKDLYKAFVAAMVWGGINASRPKRGHPGDLTTTDFYLALKNKRKGIADIMKEVERNIAISIDKAANCVVSSKTRIEGVGPSFYTKLLYFLSFRQNKFADVRPLIYDRWGRYMHAALLLDEGQGLFSEYYTPRFYDRGGFTPRYVNFVRMMAQMSRDLDLDDPGQLEAFLFGRSMNIKDNRTNDNPRFFLKNYVEDSIGL